MSEILYLKFEKNIRTYNRTVTLGEAGEMQCADTAIVNRLKTEKLYTFENVRKRRTFLRGPPCIFHTGCGGEDSGGISLPGDSEYG